MPKLLNDHLHRHACPVPGPGGGVPIRGRTAEPEQCGGARDRDEDGQVGGSDPNSRYAAFEIPARTFFGTYCCFRGSVSVIGRGGVGRGRRG